MTLPTWQSLVTAPQGNAAHLFQAVPHSSYPDAQHSLCGRVRVHHRFDLEVVLYSRRYCERCQRQIEKESAA